ncbi:hypothetical protein DFQ27_005540 [Actinomortierella ambigua]|uniref:Senescence domain-containing protein n=1 Tax=Actinomortierella ambigua TaxID=1343610 RepID=A0A9P6PYS6_9FUNG|nr:hypothetical protein DFQ27_005540 [Actinomortierella ambigua]
MADKHTASTDDDRQPLVQVVLQIPEATIHQLTNDNTKKLIGTGDLRVYSSVLSQPVHAAGEEESGGNGGAGNSNRSASSSPTPSASTGSAASMSSMSSRPAPLTTFMTLETSDNGSPRKSLITHPLLPRSTVQKISDRAWLFPVPGSGSIELTLSKIVYSNQHDLRNSLALVDDAGQIVGVLDTDSAEIVDEDDAVSLSENKKTPVVVEEAADDGTNRIKLKVSLPTSEDMSHWLTTASQYLGEGMIKGATFVAGGIESTHGYLNTKIPETSKPLKISPFIRKRIRNLTSVSRKTYSLTGRVKQAVVNRAVGMAVSGIQSWSKSSSSPPSSSSADGGEDGQAGGSYSSWQQLANALLISAGILIESAETSFGLVATPAAIAAQDLTGKYLGPEAKDVMTEALTGVGQLTLVYFDGFGISRRALLKTGRVAALQSAREIRERKNGQLQYVQQKEDEQEEEEERQKQAEEKDKKQGESTLASGVRQVKELIFRYFGHADKGGDGGGASSTSSEDEALLGKGASTSQKHGLDRSGAAGAEASSVSSSSSSTSPKTKKAHM